jgi:hypothetical protein
LFLETAGGFGRTQDILDAVEASFHRFEDGEGLLLELLEVFESAEDRVLVGFFCGWLGLGGGGGEVGVFKRGEGEVLGMGGDDGGARSGGAAGECVLWFVGA